MKIKISFALVSLLLLSACVPGARPTASPELLATNSPPGSEGDSPTAENLDTQTGEASPTPRDVDAPPAGAAPSIPNPDDYAWVEVASGFNQPLLLAHAGDGSARLFIVNQPGSIQVIENGQVLAQPFLEISGRVGNSANEQGLLGLAFHPAYAQNGYFYVNYTNNSGDTIIARFTVSSDPNLADAASEIVLLEVAQPYGNHNGGHLEFGPDGYLYIGLGDGGSGGDPAGNGQNPDTLLGSLLRIYVDGGEPYAIPVDNPFTAGGGAGEVWAYGLRNPWRFSFDSQTGDLYIADVGQNEYEEINFVPGGAAGGLNFGWNYMEGSHSYQGTPPGDAQLVGPVAEYDHSFGCSVTGGVVYRGRALPAWNGVYLYGDFCSGIVWGLVPDGGGGWQSVQLFDLGASITSFGTDESGEVYILDRGGRLLQLRGQ